MMRRTSTPVLLILAFTLALTAGPAAAQSQPGDGTAERGSKSLQQYLMTLGDVQAGGVPIVEGRTMAVALGAIGGVVAFNLITGGTGGLPFLASSAAADFGLLSATGGAVAVSRVYAVTSAAAGGLFADWLYRSSAAGPVQSTTPAAILRRIEPRQDIRAARYDSGDTGSRRQ